MRANLTIWLLSAALRTTSAATADNTIRISRKEGKQRAEFKLNGNLDCVLENEHIVCVPAAR